MPLNENLYKAIAAAWDQTPKIINEGEQAQVDYPVPIISFIDTAITPIATNRIHGGEQYTICCPFCGDTRHRLYFSYLWATTITVGGATYRCSDSLVRCFNEECQRVPANKNLIRSRMSAILEDKNLLESIQVTAVESEKVTQLANQVPIPPNLRSITDPLVPEYVRHYWTRVRGYSPEVLDKYGVKFTYLNYPVRAGARLCQQMVTIIPVYQDGDYWFYQIRLIPINGNPELGYERDQLGVELPKYIIPHGSRKNWALYNIDNAVNYKTVYLVEGVSDVWRIGDAAVARFGKTLSRAQMVLLKEKLFNKRLVIVPDMDDPQAYEEALRQQIMLQNSNVFSDVLISSLDSGLDPGDLRGNPGEVQSCLESHIILQENNMKSQFGSQGLLY